MENDPRFLNRILAAREGLRLGKDIPIESIR
jgi:hypothetical protein